HVNMILSILNQKGGAGKTTLCINLARSMQLRGLRVLIADADPQESALVWREASGREDYPAVVSVDRDGFDSDVEAVRSAFDVVLVDGAPRMDKRSQAALRAADVALVPVHPSAMDLWATRRLVGWIEDEQRRRGGKPEAAFV